MADSKIRELETGSLSDNNDYFVVATNGGDTVKIPYSALATFLLGTSLIEGSNIDITDATEQGGIKKYSISATATGSMWYFGDTQPVSANANDYWLRTDTGHYGEIDQYDGTVWTMVGTFAGRDGQDGQDGQDGITPNIDPTSKHWMIGSTDTGVVAEGQDGATGATGATGADGASISATETATTGGHIVTIHSTDPNVSDVSFTLTNGTNGTNGTDGDDGASISFATASITGGHSVTISSTDPNVNDQTFNVMDGTEIIQTTSDNRTVTLTAANWSGAEAPYVQTVSFSGMTSAIVPEIGVVISSTVETGLEQQKQWSYITRAVSGTDSITFYCYKTKPTIDLTVNIKAV